MTIILLTLVIMSVAIGIMTIGVIFGRKPIKGSCGGLSSVGLEGACELCANPSESCKNKKKLAKDEYLIDKH